MQLRYFSHNILLCNILLSGFTEEIVNKVIPLYYKLSTH